MSMLDAITTEFNQQFASLPEASVRRAVEHAQDALAYMELVDDADATRLLGSLVRAECEALVAGRDGAARVYGINARRRTG